MTKTKAESHEMALGFRADRRGGALMAPGA
jgi:hypothetical protein